MAADIGQKRSLQPAAKRGAVGSAVPKLGLRSRAALEDIGNLVTEPKKQPAAKKVTVQRGCKKQPDIRPTLAPSLGTRRTLRSTIKEDVPPPAPEPQPESPQVLPLASLGPCAPSHPGPELPL